MWHGPYSWSLQLAGTDFWCTSGGGGLSFVRLGRQGSLYDNLRSPSTTLVQKKHVTVGACSGMHVCVTYVNRRSGEGPVLSMNCVKDLWWPA